MVPLANMRKRNFIHYYKWAISATAIIAAIVFWLSGLNAVIPLLALALLELAFSFENAVINSQVLSTMNRFWRMMFLTVGILVAVFAVRLILPLFLVSVTTGNSIGHVFDISLHHPEVYAEELHSAYPTIAAFGGVFLLMVGLRFFGERRKVRWLNQFEGPLSAFNQPWWVSIAGAVLATLALYFLIAPGKSNVAIAGLLGAVVFLLIKFVSQLLIGKASSGKDLQVQKNPPGYIQFLYLELLDATFSFDGVIAAFAITKEVILIAAGLGIGALFVRSITIHLLEDGTLAEYRYLIHGAHYAILCLSLLLIVSIRVSLPEVLTGVIGLVIIGMSILSSRRKKRYITA